MKTITSLIVLALVCTGSLYAQSHYVIQAAKETKWGPAPNLIPPGAKIAVLSGDPSKPAAYTVRLKFPAHYTIMPHSHPTDENVVVVSGGMTFGMGDTLTHTASDNKTLGRGGYLLMPQGMNHFAYTGNEEATIVLYGIGPVDFKYVNPADDPRNTPKSAAK